MLCRAIEWYSFINLNIDFETINETNSATLDNYVVSWAWTSDAYSRIHDLLGYAPEIREVSLPGFDFEIIFRSDADAVLTKLSDIFPANYLI